MVGHKLWKNWLIDKNHRLSLLRKRRKNNTCAKERRKDYNPFLLSRSVNIRSEKLKYIQVVLNKYIGKIFQSEEFPSHGD